MKFFDKLKRKKSIPYHFEVHDDEFLVEVESFLDKSKVFDMFFKGVKRMRVKSSVGCVEDLPDFYEADKKQRKSVESIVVNKRFLNDIVEQVKKDVPTFNIIDSELSRLTFTLVSPNQYKQKITIKGICFYEE